MTKPCFVTLPFTFQHMVNHMVNLHICDGLALPFTL